MRALITVAVAAVVASALALPASAGQKPKPKLNPCKTLLPADLEPIFEQPFRRGTEELGGACAFRHRPPDADEDDVEVALILEEESTKKRAAKAFARSRRATRELAGEFEPIRGMGDEAFFSKLIGDDVLTLRVGRRVAELRIDRLDDELASYHDQAIAVGEIVEARLLPPPSEKPKKRS